MLQEPAMLSLHLAAKRVLSSLIHTMGNTCTGLYALTGHHSFTGLLKVHSHGYNEGWAAQVAQQWRTHLPMQETQEMWVRSLGQEDPLETGMATHASTLAWIFQGEEPNGLQPMGSPRIGHSLGTKEQSGVRGGKQEGSAFGPSFFRKPLLDPYSSKCLALYLHKELHSPPLSTTK